MLGWELGIVGHSNIIYIYVCVYVCVRVCLCVRVRVCVCDYITYSLNLKAAFLVVSAGRLALLNLVYTNHKHRSSAHT